MNILRRSITSKLSLYAHPSTKLRSLLYSTTYTLNPPKPPRRSRTPVPPPPPPPSSASKAEAVNFANFRRPSEIPFQAKVANLVNLIGHIKAPVKFLAAPDGKYWASTAIYQDNIQEGSCLIPIVFEGDLAHTATLHVKENDCVYVNGRLSEEPLPFLPTEISVKLHLRVENINFVQGFEEQRKSRKKFGGNASSDRDGTVIESKEEYISDDFSIEKGAAESIVAPAAEKYRTARGSFGHKKDEDPAVVDSWRHLVQNSTVWLDYRGQKSRGLVSSKFPDFKHKDTDTALWIGSAPGWVLAGLGSLEFGLPPPPRQKQVKDAKEDSAKGPPKQNQFKDAREDLWRNLVEKPNDWWDNRLNKKNPKAPDFKHKTRGEALWLGKTTPEWVLSKLSLAGGQYM